MATPYREDVWRPGSTKKRGKWRDAVVANLKETHTKDCNGKVRNRKEWEKIIKFMAQLAYLKAI